MFKNLFIVLLIFCASNMRAQAKLVVLGTVQDGGSPHIMCLKGCCTNLSSEEKAARQVTALGLSSGTTDYYLFEASPNITLQMQHMQALGYFNLAGIFLTHAHIGHYMGLLYLGREAWGANKVPVYAMPRLRAFLRENGPWSQLVDLENITLQALENKQPQQLPQGIKVTPFVVPHRDEFSETVGYYIAGPNKTALFLPDIDKWNKWEKDIGEAINSVDYAFIDASFYDAAEINYRPIAEIPHPFVIETLEQLKEMEDYDRKKVFFIHMNHTNPLLNPNSEATKKVEALGFSVARIGNTFSL
jgi:pyrroloquinoline quinone biosynthesis protein B